MERVYFPGDPAHPDAATIRRLFPPNLYGAMVSFEIRGAGRAEVFRFMDALKMIVRATSLGDVHSMMLYPVMSSHREISPEAPRAHGHPRQPGAALGGHRGAPKTSSPTSIRRSLRKLLDKNLHLLRGAVLGSYCNVIGGLVRQQPEVDLDHARDDARSRSCIYHLQRR